MLKKHIINTIAIPVLWASCLSLPAHAQSEASEYVDAFMEILEQHECSATTDQIEDAFQARFPENIVDLPDIAVQAGQNGQIGLNTRTEVVTLYSETCGNAEQAPFPKFLDIMAQNGCSMTEDQAEPIFLAANLQKQDIRFIVKILMDTDRAELTGETLKVLPPDCSPN